MIVLIPAILSVLAMGFDYHRLSEDAAYQREQKRFSMIRETCTTLVFILFLLFGGFSLSARISHDLSYTIGGGELVQGVFFALILVFLERLLALPFALYATFSIEARYGFNKTSPKTFFADEVKGFFLLCLIGLPIFLLIYAFYDHFGPSGWLLAWIGYTLFSLLLSIIAPTVILPLFNRFTPLANESLKTRISGIAEQAGIKVKRVEVIDGSRRSTKANAYVAGFGSSKRVALYDTFIDKHSEEEIVAVLAHEFGHIAKKHVVKQFISQTILSAPIFYLLFWAVASPILPEAVGFPSTEIYTAHAVALIVLVIVMGFLSAFFAPLFLLFSRKREREADLFAAKLMGTGDELVSALLSLEKQNGGHPDPHPLSVFLHYSHPPTRQRVALLKSFSP
ncbi:M48 family metallopeptidase [Sediminispirochaeta smaragdinae]|uniref:Ste24 endopeptidase n=1 Tax=Sediminispirochaeta smaragdinae (strain DSM 11293 / JCM 15392 / SEBR 4228) TaxID=573413 RepID=E1R4Z0_SEDSS|nr:Ste24 endopeptidase [Sediminispirochaeta smaragdinae DSM 11293]